MPVLTGDEGAIIIALGAGDILVACGEPKDESQSFVELVFCLPGDIREPGELAYDLSGDTKKLNAKVRIQMHDAKSAAIVMNAVNRCLVRLMGMEPD